MTTYKLNFSATCPQTNQTIYGKSFEEATNLESADDYAEIEAIDLFEKNFNLTFTKAEIGFDAYEEARLPYIAYSVRLVSY